MTWDNFMDKLNMLPKINTAYVYDWHDNPVTGTQTINVIGDNENDVKEQLMESVNDKLSNARVAFVRVYPEIKELENGQFSGYARVAAVT
jgi:hypothetical protein